MHAENIKTTQKYSKLTEFYRQKTSFSAILKIIAILKSFEKNFMSFSKFQSHHIPGKCCKRL
jgi:hypothetical protein